jgi:hypothetical protein
MKKNISIFGLLAAILLAFNVSSASADPTYAVLDANGNVTNIIVCGSACASGEFGGNKVVLQVAADPVTGANRGGIWQGPGTTTYNENNGAFTVTHQPIQTTASKTDVVENTSLVDIYNVQESTNLLTVNEDGTETTTIVTRNWTIEEENKIKITSSAVVTGESSSYSFTYNDTIGSNLFTRNNFVKNWSDNSDAVISVNKDETQTISKISDGTKSLVSTDTQNQTESISFDERKTSQEIQDSVTNSNLLLLNFKIQTLISLLGSWVK